MNPIFHPAFVAVANATSRNNGAVGYNAIAPRWVRENVTSSWSILDYGAGKTAAHTAMLKEHGFSDITAHDFGANFNPSIHNPFALSYRYNVVMASNVLNTLSTAEMLMATVDEIAAALTYNGFAILNYPESPRKLRWITGEGVEFSSDDVYWLITEGGKYSLERVGGTGKAPLWKMRVVR